MDDLGARSHIYIYIYICIHIYTYTHINLHINIHIIYIYTCHICVYIYIYNMYLSVLASGNKRQSPSAAEAAGVRLPWPHGSASARQPSALSELSELKGLHIYIYICIFSYTCVSCVRAFIGLCYKFIWFMYSDVYTHCICMYICTYRYVSISIYTCMSIQYVYMYICAYTAIHIYIYVHMITIYSQIMYVYTAMTAMLTHDRSPTLKPKKRAAQCQSSFFRALASPAERL